MTMRLASFAIVVTLAAMSASGAQAQTRSYQYDRGDGTTVQYMCNGGNCVENTWKKGDPTPKRESERDSASREARERAWAERCKPEKYVDGEGLTRYRYAAKGCDGAVVSR